MRECPQCGKREELVGSGVCQGCEEETDEAYRRLDELREGGHSYHCAARMIWGDGECECKER